MIGCPKESLREGRVYVFYGGEDDGDDVPDEVDTCPRVPNPDQLDSDGDGLGDACDPDIDGDGYANASDTCPLLAEDIDGFQDGDGCPDPDNDQDGIPDVDDLCPGDDLTVGPDGVADSGDEPLNEWEIPIQTKEDYDGVQDGDGCHDSPDDDYDGDGFTDEVEVQVGTHPVDPCGSDGWPADLFSGGASANRVNLQDVTSFVVPVLRFNTSPGEPGYDVRWDLVPGPNGFSSDINLQDITALIILSPPMLGDLAAFNGPSCPDPAP